MCLNRYSTPAGVEAVKGTRRRKRKKIWIWKWRCDRDRKRRKLTKIVPIVINIIHDMKFPLLSSI